MAFQLDKRCFQGYASIYDSIGPVSNNVIDRETDREKHRMNIKEMSQFREDNVGGSLAEGLIFEVMVRSVISDQLRVIEMLEAKIDEQQAMLTR